MAVSRPATASLPYSCNSSGLLSSSASIKGGPGILVNILVFTNGTADATVTVYDNPSAASGTVLAQAVVVGADKMGGVVGILAEASSGLYLSISGTGASAIVHYI